MTELFLSAFNSLLRGVFRRNSFGGVYPDSFSGGCVYFVRSGPVRLMPGGKGGEHRGLSISLAFSSRMSYP